MKKEVVANYAGHTIRVVNTWFSGAKLYLDGDCRDSNTELFVLDKNAALMSAQLEVEGQKRLVEVFCQALFTVKIKICVDGELVGGESF